MKPFHDDGRIGRRFRNLMNADTTYKSLAMRSRRSLCSIPSQLLGVIFVLIYLLMYLVLYMSLLKVPQVSLTGEQNSQKLGPLIDFEAETQKSLQYVQSIKDTKRQLVFVHIPKAAGTTIEEVGGLQAKLDWGSCRFNHRPKRQGGVCRYPPGQFEWPSKIGYWHLPPQFFPLKGVNPYENFDLFAVVRDPRERLLSEFLYVCKKEKNSNWNAIACDQSRIRDPIYFNEWIQGKLSASRSLAVDYLEQNGHYTPQYDFIVANGNVRMVDYVLRMKELKTEFQPLMDAYGIHVALPTHKKNAARDEITDLSVEHIDKTTDNMLIRIYEHDFDLMVGGHQ
jgi:hypothetical protein